MKMFYRFGLLLLCAVVTGCGTTSAPPPPPPPASLSQAPPLDVMRSGDKITIRLTGVPDDGYVIEVQLPSDGTVTVPYLTRNFHAIGLSTGDLAASIAEAYKNDKIYTNPHVIVLPEERFVNVSGDVRGAQRVAYTPDLTLLTAITSCGGFDEYADRHHVRITRGQQLIVIDAIVAERNPGTDPPVYPGDQIYVPRTIF